MTSKLENKLATRLAELPEEHLIFKSFVTGGTVAVNLRNLERLLPVRNHAPFANNDMSFDFAWPDFRIAIEVQGGVDRNDRKSGHLSHGGIRRDMYKLNLAQVNNWIMFQFPPEICKDDDYWDKYGLFFLIKAFRRRFNEYEFTKPKSAI